MSTKTKGNVPASASIKVRTIKHWPAMRATSGAGITFEYYLGQKWPFLWGCRP